MVKYGALFVCDRCGKEKFVERKTHLVSEEDEFEGKLCPDCQELYHKMLNNFFAPEVKRSINLGD